MEDTKIISSIPHDHEKETRSNVVEKFRKVLTKKAVEKPNKSLVDIYLEETLNHSEASILYPFSQAESTMRKARAKVKDKTGKDVEKGKKSETKLDKNAQKSDNEKIETKTTTLISFNDKIECTAVTFDSNLDCAEKISSEEKQKFNNENNLGNENENLEMFCELENQNLSQNDRKDSQNSFSATFENESQVFMESHSTLICNESSNSRTDEQECKNAINVNEMPQRFCENPEVISFEPQENLNERKIEEFQNCLNTQEQNFNFISNSIEMSEELSNSIESRKHLEDQELLRNLSEKTSTSFENFSSEFQENCETSEKSMNFSNSLRNPFQNPTNTSQTLQRSFQIQSNLSQTAPDLTQFKLNLSQNPTNLSSSLPNFSQNNTSSLLSPLNASQISSKSDKKVNNLKFSSYQKYFYHENFDQMIIILMNQTTLKTLGQIDEIHVDFEVKIEVDENKMSGDEKANSKMHNFPSLVPIHQNTNKNSTISNLAQSSFQFQQNSNHKNFHNLITILAVIKGRDCPIAFGILQDLNQTTLINFFHLFNLKIPLNPSTILTNPNEILQFSLKSIYQNSNIKILYFYYAKSTLKMVKNFKEISKNVFYQSSLKMILAMPMIPTNYVVPGFEALRKWMSEKNVNMQDLCRHVYDTWLSENAEKISIFNGLTHTINNQTQIFARELINEFKSEEKFNIDEVVDKISKLATKFYIKFSKNNENAMKKAQKLQKSVKFATKSWISSPFHLRRPIQFLQQVSHCIDDGIIAFVMNYDENDVKICKKRKIDEKILNIPPLVFYDKKNIKISEPPPLVMIKK